MYLLFSKMKKFQECKKIAGIANKSKSVTKPNAISYRKTSMNKANL